MNEEIRFGDRQLELMRTFDTGATRDTDEGKPRYGGFQSPLVMRRFGDYMLRHQRQSDGTVRPADNWKRGIPKRECLESLFRHFVDLWLLDEGFAAREGIEEALCGILFNAQAYLHYYLTTREARTHDER